MPVVLDRQNSPSTAKLASDGGKLEGVDENVPETVDRLTQEDAKFQNFWVGVTNLVESYRYQKRKPEREPSTFIHTVQHTVVSLF